MKAVRQNSNVQGKMENNEVKEAKKLQRARVNYPP